MKSKSFIIGIICGIFIASGVGYAADHFEIEVKLPNIPYIYDGEELNLGQSSALPTEDPMPETINYRNVNYVSVRALAEAMGKEVSWDSEAGQVLIHSVEKLEFEVVDAEQAPAEISSWVSRSLDEAHVKTRLHGDITYVLITLGEKNSGGYDIHVTDVKQYYNKIVVHYDVTEPDKGTPVINAFTYPFELIALSGEYEVPIHFVENGSATQ